MVGEPQINMVGNLVADPELRFTPSGVAAASVRIAVTPRSRDNATGEWKDGETVWLSGTVWRQYAENVAETLTKGMRVVVTGRLKQRSYETKEGEKRTTIELEVDEIGPSLRYATAQVTRVQSGRGYSGGSTYGDPAKPANQQQGWQDGSPTPAQNLGAPEGDPWAQAPATTPGTAFGVSNDFPSNDSDPEL